MPRSAGAAKRSQSLGRERYHSPGHELSISPNAYIFSCGKKNRDLKMCAQVSQPSPHSSVILEDPNNKK